MTIEYDQDYVDLLDRNNSSRFRVRQEWRRRVEAGKPVRTAPRALPSGPAPSWTGFALALLLLTAASMAMSVGLGLWLAYRLLSGAGKLLRGSDDAATT